MHGKAAHGDGIATKAVARSRSSGACWLSGTAREPRRRPDAADLVPGRSTTAAHRASTGVVAAAERCSRSNLAAAISQPRVCRRSSLCRERCHVISPVHEHRAGGRIGVVAVRPRASFARGEQLAPHSPRLRSTFPLIHVSGQANSEHNTEALGGMWGCTTRRCRRWRSAAWWMGGEARGVPGSSCRSARGGRRLWVGLGSLAMRPAVSKIQNLTHSDPAMRRIRGLRVPCCCVDLASLNSQRFLPEADFRLLELPLACGAPLALPDAPVPHLCCISSGCRPTQ